MYLRTITTFISLLMAGALLTACNQPAGQATANSNRVEKNEIVNTRNQVLEEARQKREARTQELKSMDVPRLATELAKESQKGTEPFNSMTFTEMVSRGRDGATALAPLITQADRSSLLSLLALRKMNREEYQKLKPELRVGILTNSLKTQPYFNTFGMPHTHWEDAAKAIIEEGRAAEKPLLEMLSDHREAPTWGSESYMEYQRYKYRVSDYAWALLNEIRGQKVEIPPDPAARDRLQAQMKPS
ncbi:MAG TPA: hypothetical protein VJT50_12355 [Pyrinomonadaceae bacterium]|nr:hypothetical protein [Pyrinomonadaceae bacterium]